MAWFSVISSWVHRWTKRRSQPCPRLGLGEIEQRPSNARPAMVRVHGDVLDDEPAARRLSTSTPTETPATSAIVACRVAITSA